MRISLILASLVLCQTIAAAEGRTFYADPIKGDMAGDGSQSRPWKSLADVAQGGQLGHLKPGDTLLLRSGRHGSVTFAGDNAGMVTIAAEKGQTPQLTRLNLSQGSNWTIRGLTISPTFGEPYGGTCVTLGEQGPSHDLVLEDCYIYSTLDTTSWSIDDWIKANSGINMGRNGTHLTVRNNHILNTRFGINICAPDSLCEGNIISDFSGDGIRATRDGDTVQYNVIKNVYASMGDGDKNHDDGIQCFLFNKGTGTVRKLTVRGNVLINREDPQQRHPAGMQGLGFFDGPLVDFAIENNVILAGAWHGIALYDAQHCRITGNTVFSLPVDAKMKSWIMLGVKPKIGGSTGNTVSDNQAWAFKLKDDRSVQAERNTTVTPASFELAYRAAMAEITKRFGEKHPVSGQTRVRSMEFR
jgi:hypothetical protein